MPSNNKQEADAIRQVRSFFYDLVKSFFLEEPDREKVDRWCEIVKPLVGEAPDLTLRESARQLSLALTESKLPMMADEYYSYFINPFSPRLIGWTVSAALNGRNFGPKLVEIRQLMAQHGLIKEEKFKEPEDSLPVLLDLMARLIDLEEELGESAVMAQRHILQEFLLPLAAYLKQRLESGFYASCAAFLQSWLRFDENYFI